MGDAEEQDAIVATSSMASVMSLGVPTPASTING